MTLSPEFVLSIILAGALGSIVGIERARSGQSAGVRTNLMIAVASCMFTWLGVEVFTKLSDGPQDTARIAAQVVSGVGFLGAGTMLQTKNKIRGLTTAATIWLHFGVYNDDMGGTTGMYLDDASLLGCEPPSQMKQLYLPMIRNGEPEAGPLLIESVWATQMIGHPQSETVYAVTANGLYRSDGNVITWALTGTLVSGRSKASKSGIFACGAAVIF